MSQITKQDRREIEYYLKKGYKCVAISEMLSRNKSVIYREVKRNSVNGSYDAEKAHVKGYQRRYWVMTEPQKVRTSQSLIRYIEEKLKQKNPWSPEQIAGRWNIEEAQKYGFKITHPTIYKYLYKHRPSLCKQLCTKRYKPKKWKQKPKREIIKNRIWIDDRPKHIEQKTRIGDWEGDTIVSVKEDKTSLLVLHDRASRYICVSKTCDKKSKRITRKVKKMLRNKPQKTLSVDSGIEFRGHEKFGITTYFCHPYSSWEKGGVEYSNRLLRRHFPKKTILAEYSPKLISLVVEAINHTPRKCLGFKTPHEVFFNHSYPKKLSSKVAFTPLI